MFLLFLAIRKMWAWSLVNTVNNKRCFIFRCLFPIIRLDYDRSPISSLLLIFAGTYDVACGLSFSFCNSPTEYFAAFVLPLISVSFWQPSLLLLMLLFLIYDIFLALSINPSFFFWIFGMILVCVLPSIIVGFFQHIYQQSICHLSKIWDLVFTFANSSVCLSLISQHCKCSILFFCGWGFYQ